MVVKNIIIVSFLLSVGLSAQQEPEPKTVRQRAKVLIATGWHCINFLAPKIVMTYVSFHNVKYLLNAPNTLMSKYGKKKPDNKVWNSIKKLWAKTGLSSEAQRIKIVKDVLEKSGLDPDKIALYPTKEKEDTPFFALGNNIVFTSNIKKPLTKRGQEQEVEDLEFSLYIAHDTEEFRYIVAHEAAHIKNNDGVNTVAFMFISPWLSHAMLYGYKYGIQKLIDFIIDKSNLKKESKIYKSLAIFKKVNGWLSDLCITQCALAIYLSLCTHSKYMEKRADLSAAHVVGADGGISYFERLTRALPNKSDLYSSHPSDETRLAYLKAFKAQ